jgi:hypothetical protein
MTAILTVTGMTTTALAVQLDDNPSGSTTSIGAGDTMENNWGTIDSNEGHLTNNEGDVLSNGGDIDENWGNVTNVDNGSVGTNHTGGEVTDGSVTENYGTTNCSIVTNNYQSGTVNSGTLENNYLGQTDGADVTGVNILDEGAVPDGIPINDPKPNAPAEPEHKKEEQKKGYSPEEIRWEYNVVYSVDVDGEEYTFEETRRFRDDGSHTPRVGDNEVINYAIKDGEFIPHPETQETNGTVLCGYILLILSVISAGLGLFLRK